MSETPRKSVAFFESVQNAGQSIMAFGHSVVEKVANLFADDADEDEAPIFTRGEELEEEADESLMRGNGYELSFMAYHRPERHQLPYFFTSQLGAPFPSYHCNPTQKFPSRWTQIPNVRPPVENIVAPRIRLGPRELNEDKQQLMDEMRKAVRIEGKNQPKPRVLNLSHQALGDPYQYEALVTFLDLNRQIDELNLNDNELEDINDLDLENIRILHLSRNNIATFMSIPSLPNCKELYVCENFITGLSGLTSSKFPVLEKIGMAANPFERAEKSRETIAKTLKTLKKVDNMDAEKLRNS